MYSSSTTKKRNDAASRDESYGVVINFPPTGPSNNSSSPFGLPSRPDLSPQSLEINGSILRYPTMMCQNNNRNWIRNDENVTQSTAEPTPHERQPQVVSPTTMQAQVEESRLVPITLQGALLLHYKRTKQEHATRGLINRPFATILFPGNGASTLELINEALEIMSSDDDGF